MRDIKGVTEFLKIPCADCLKGPRRHRQYKVKQSNVDRTELKDLERVLVPDLIAVSPLSFFVVKGDGANANRTKASFGVFVD